MRLLDLFCCAGGAGVGYARAGFEVTGVDIAQRDNYPFAFHQADALAFLQAHGHEYDVIHASPPCQGYSKHVSSRSSKWVPTRGKDEPRLIEPLRVLLEKLGKPYIIENVTSARDHMVDPVMLCGTMFGLPISRHRLFETNFDLAAPEHPKCRGVAKAFAAEKGWEYRDMSVTGKGRRAGTAERWMEIMGIDWPMKQSEIAESIPPSYTEYIGRQLIENETDMTEEIHIDLETRSRTDLLTDGVYNYATCPSTEIICMSWAFGNGEIQRWEPLLNHGEPFPPALEKYIRDGVKLLAHNAAFERLMFDYIICPEQGLAQIPLDQWFCTAYQAQCNNVPRALFNAARCLGVEQQKDRAGRNLIQMLSIPQPDGSFNEDPTLLAEMAAYCDQDVRTERDIAHRLREPSINEWLDYFTSERVNDRGVRVDLPVVQAAQLYAKEEEADIISQVTKLSDGAITKFRGPALLAWVRERIEPHQLEALKVYRGGEKKYSLDKFSRHRLMDLTDLDPLVREVVSCADTAYKSSVGKFRALEHRADPWDHRLRGAFVANGASASGRFSSWGAQVHNFPRDVAEKPEEVRLDLIENIMAEDMVDYFDAPIMNILSSMLRPSLIPAEGCVFVGSDWSAIEGRVNPWLAKSREGELKLNLYREDVDTYKVAAGSIYHKAYDDIDKSERQVGKVAELALGFGGGSGAFLAMARGYGVVIPKHEAEVIKNRWREGNPWAPALWAGCERAAMSALSNPGQRYDVGRVSYFAVNNVLIGRQTLFCELPCGRLLTYPDARIESKIAPWGERVPQVTALRANWTPKTTEKEWPRSSLWGGLLCENIVQGTAASLLRHALREAHSVGLEVVLHVHDELVVESPRDSAENAAKALHRIMNTPPKWAEGLPLAADVEIMERFGK